MNILIVLQLVGHFDIVVNCTGLGSKYLLPDESVYAVKGQLIQVSEANLLFLYKLSIVLSIKIFVFS